MNKLRKSETGEEEKEGDKEHEKIEGRRRRRGKKEETRNIRFRTKKSEMGCETQCKKENQEEPGETKGDTEKLRCAGGEDRCFLCFVFVHTNQDLSKKAKRGMMNTSN